MEFLPSLAAPMSNEVPASSTLCAGAPRAAAGFSSGALFLANPAARCSTGAGVGAAAGALATAFGGPASEPNK